jgi:predicted Rossmann fold flavoprotein
MKKVVVIGGGAAGFFAAINCAEKNPDFEITLFEKSSSLLSKVKISGGGRCNVTYACFNARELVKNYPRGEKQLLGPFTRFNPSNTIQWFRQRDVEIKKQKDGRMFPVTDSSQTIIDCFLQEAKRLGIKIKMQSGIEEMQSHNSGWQLKTSKGETNFADSVIVTSGSSHHIWGVLKKLGHKIITPVPSLFTFNIPDNYLKGLEGLSVDNAVVSVAAEKIFKSSGALLITHWGFSGPAILKLSAWGAVELAEKKYRFELYVNWINKNWADVVATLKQSKLQAAKKNVQANPMFDIPRRLWEKFVEHSQIKSPLNFADLSNRQIEMLASTLTASVFSVNGKSTFKDEFVTAGGVDLKEIDFTTMQSRKFPGLFFAGEVLNIDAITGGFNFQAAWTTGYIAAISV